MEFTGLPCPVPPLCEAMLQANGKCDRTGFRVRGTNIQCPPLILKILHETPMHKSAEINRSYLFAFICILQKAFCAFAACTLNSSLTGAGLPPDHSLTCHCRMMWAAGIVAAVSSITFPAVSTLVSQNAESNQQGEVTVPLTVSFPQWRCTCQKHEHL